ncbi:MAG: SigB/SigF/SigG family RNA polymerase sigma factor [Clostridia bacterium]|nr:SigB/SigF/SigG family RNA polymerase sigma factor [Clostridia bacterium]
MLDVEQTNCLIRKAKQGDSGAKETLLVENGNLIKSIVRRYLGKGVEYDDLYQLASMGLLKAINGFDESFGVRFSTYAVPMIAGEIKRFMRDDGSIKVSRQLKSTAKKINLFIEEYTAAHGAQPSVKTIAEKFEMPESEVVFTMGSTHMPVSIYNQGEYKDEKTQELLDKLPVEDRQEDIIEMLQLKTAIAGLSDRDKKIIMLRYFRDMTQSEVATMLGVSQVQISRIENRIMETFRKDLTG